VEQTTRPTAFDVARFFLTLSEPDAGDFLSNLKLQKLCYYAQGFHLAMFDEPLFPDSIVAWEHGPVVPEVYEKYRGHGGEAIPVPTDVDFGVLPERAQEMMREVWDTYGQFSAWKLRNLTHAEPPWKKTRRGSVISIELMKDYFRTQLK
jgi:uncharacterized phage-associated protein